MYIKLTHYENDALLSLLDDFDPSELTASELAAIAKLKMIREAQKRHNAFKVQRTQSQRQSQTTKESTVNV